MNKKTIQKFNSPKSPRPVAWLALAILAVGAFGNSVQAQTVWLNDTLSGYTSDGVALTTTTSPQLVATPGTSWTVSVTGSVKKLRTYKPAGAGPTFGSAVNSAASRLAYKLSTDANNAIDRPVGYLSYKITPGASMANTFSANGLDGSYMEAGLGPTGLDVPSSAGQLLIWGRFYFNNSATSPQYKVRFYHLKADFTTQSVGSGPVTLNAGENTVKIWYNKSNSGVSYTPPGSGSSVILAANSWVAYVNDTIATGLSNTGVAFVNNSSYTVSPATSTAVGKFAAFNGSSGHTYDFSLSDIYVADTAPSSGVAITSAPTATAQAGYPFSYTIRSSGVTSPSYSASPLPSGLSVDSSTGVISGTLDTTATSTTIGLTANGTGGPATANLALTVTPAPTVVPSFTSTGIASGFLTKTFSYSIQATVNVTTPSSIPTSYAIDPTTPLPAGLSLTASTGIIGGIPTATGVTTVTYTATNPFGTSDAQTLTITINPAPVFTWNNNGTAWTTGTSWTNGVAPANSASTDIAAFGNLGSSATSVDVGTGKSIGGIVFNSGAYAYTWTGTDISVGGTTGITNNAAVTQTFGNKIINVGADATWSSVSGGSIVFNGGIDLGSTGVNRKITFAGAGNATVNGVIANGGSSLAGQVAKLGAGTLLLNGTNTFMGSATVNEGTMILSGPNSTAAYTISALTDNAGPVLKVTLTNAMSSSAILTGSSSLVRVGTLDLATAGDYIFNQYNTGHMNFTTTSGAKTTLIFTNANNVMSAGGGRTLANQSTNLKVTFSGSLDIAGTTADNCSISGVGPIVISNRVYNSNTNFIRGLTKKDAGTLTIYGTNSYKGTTTVSGGTLVIPAGGSLADCGNTIVSGSSTNSASLNLAGSAGVVQVSTNGFVRGYPSESTTTLGTITSLEAQEAGTVEVAVGTTWTTGGTIDFAAGSKVSVTGTPATGNTYTLMSANAAITGTKPALVGATGWALRVDGANLLLEEVVAIDIYDIGVGVTTTFSDIITGTAPLVKKGLGTAIITGNNDFTGGTVLQAGTLQVGHANGLGTGAVTLTSGTLKSTVDLNLGRLVGTTATVGSADYQAVYGANSRLQYSGRTTTINGAVTLDVAAETTMTMGTLAGNSSASSLVTKIGAGTVKLMGGSTKLDDAGMALNGNASSVLGGWRIQEGTVWFAPSANNGAGNGPITLAGGNAKFTKLQNSNGTYTGFEVPSDLTVESDGLIQFDPDPVTLLGQNNLGFKDLSIGANTLEVATATTSTVQNQALPSVNFKSATLTGSATLKNPANLDLNLQAVSGTSGFTKTGLGTLYLSDQPNRAAAFAALTGTAVASINVEYAGSGYQVAPIVTVVAVNGGSGATAIANIDKGRVTSITVTAPGSGYTSIPRVQIDPPTTVATVNSYTGPTTVLEGKLNLNGSYASSVTIKSGAALQLDWLAPAQAKCSIDAISPTASAPNAAYSYVKNLYLTKSVGGYQPGTFEFDLPAPVKADGTGTATGTATYVLAAARASATVDSNGFISALTIVNGGSGYAITPMVTIPAPTVPTVVATTTGSITFEPGARLALNIGTPTSASYTLVTADGGITGTPSLETAISGYTLKKSSDNKSLLLEVVKTTPTITITPYLGYTYTGSIQGPGVNEVNKGGSAGGVTLSYMGTGSTTYGPSDIPPINAGTYTLTATVASDSFYNEASSTPTAFTIAKANPTVSVAPTASAVTVGAQLSTSNLSGGTPSVAGTFAWTTPSTVVSATASYAVTFTPTDGANYNTASSTASVTANPAGTTYSTWLSGNGGTASDAAFLNYVFGAVTAGSLDASLKPTVAVTGGNLVLTYNVRQGTVGLTVTAQTSADLATGAAGWGTSGITDVAVGTPRTVNGVSVQQRTASVSASGGKKFLRVKAEQAP